MTDLIPGFRYEFHIQSTDRGDLPNTIGLSDSLRLPSGSNVVPGKTRVLYEWRPSDGREREKDTVLVATSLLPVTTWVLGPDGGLYEIIDRSADNKYALKPREDGRTPMEGIDRIELTPVMGHITKPHLAYQMEERHLDRYVASLQSWIDTWSPQGFTGLMCVDLEMFPWYSHQMDTPAGSLADMASLFPSFTYAELLARFVTITNEFISHARPGCQIGWYGAGGANPNNMLWHPSYKNDIFRSALRDMYYTKKAGIPMPVYYYLEHLESVEDRQTAVSTSTDLYLQVFGRTRLFGGYAYLSTERFSHTNTGSPGTMLTKDEVKEVLQYLITAGFTKFIVWTALRDSAHRDRTQNWIDSTFVPALIELGIYRR